MNKILIVVDMQNDFINGSLGSEAAQAIVPNVVSKIKNFDGDCIIVTMDTHKSNYLETQEGKKLPVEHCIENTNGWRINTQVAEALEKGCPVHTLMKSTFGAKNIADMINSAMQLQNIDEKNLEIELVGLDTDICVISNAILIKAFFLDAQVKIDSSCCAGTSTTAHECALEVAKSCQIDVI